MEQEKASKMELTLFMNFAQLICKMNKQKGAKRKSFNFIIVLEITRKMLGIK